MDTIQKLNFRAKAGIKDAKEELESRIDDKLLLSLKGINGEDIYLTGVSELEKRILDIKKLYKKVPQTRKVSTSILLEAHSSATIEGAHTTVERVKQCIDNPTTKDEKMVVNAIKASKYAYDNKITSDNIRFLWELVVEDVCENESKKGKLYRIGMVYIGDGTRIVHTPQKSELIEESINNAFNFFKTSKLDGIIKAFIFHFYFVYIHPFCDGNGRMARIINNSQLYHFGLKKMKHLPISTFIDANRSGYYKTITECEKFVLKNEEWLDISPFVSYMIDVFEQCIMNAILSTNLLTKNETLLLDKMNKNGKNSEITVKRTMKILKLSKSACRNILNSLVDKGYLKIDKSKKEYMYILLTSYNKLN